MVEQRLLNQLAGLWSDLARTVNLHALCRLRLVFLSRPKECHPLNDSQELLHFSLFLPNTFFHAIDWSNSRESGSPGPTALLSVRSPASSQPWSLSFESGNSPALRLFVTVGDSHTLVSSAILTNTMCSTGRAAIQFIKASLWDDKWHWAPISRNRLSWFLFELVIEKPVILPSSRATNV